MQRLQKRLTQSVQVCSLAILLLLSSGCSTFGWNSVKPVEVQTKAVERTRLDLADPAPLKLKSPEWILITPENQKQVFDDLQKNNKDLVLFGLTDEGYEELSSFMLDIRNHISSQKTILIKYREYYEPPVKETK